MAINYHIVCVGCGGTGTYFVKEFARFMSAYHYPDSNIYLAIIDGDRVEEKNLERQCFTPLDIGTLKAVAMGEAVKVCFGLSNVYAYPFYLDGTKQLEAVFCDLHEAPQGRHHGYRERNNVDIVVGCVDNHRARQVMESFFKKSRSLFYFDAANEYSNGEVVFGGKHGGETLGKTRAYYFPGIMKSRVKRAGEVSCGIINQAEPQHMLTNMMAANILLGKLLPMLSGGRITLGIAYFDAFAGFSSFVNYQQKGDTEDAKPVPQKRIARKHHKTDQAVG